MNLMRRETFKSNMEKLINSCKDSRNMVLASDESENIRGLVSFMDSNIAALKELSEIVLVDDEERDKQF